MGTADNSFSYQLSLQLLLFFLSGKKRQPYLYIHVREKGWIVTDENEEHSNFGVL